MGGEQALRSVEPERAGAEVGSAAPRTGSTRRVLAVGSLALLPLLLLFGFFYGPVLHRGRPLGLSLDSRYYEYQVARVADLDGRWWKLAIEEPVGRPYPSAMARLPELYEGVDLLAINTVLARLFRTTPETNYYLLVALVVCLNGWVAAWVAWRMTHSVACAALATALIILNGPTAVRMGAHLHYFKHAWSLLVLLAFCRYLDRPTPWSGLLLAAAFLLVLEGCFYMGYFAGVVFGAWWLAALVAGRIGRRHIWPTLLAVVVLVTLVPLFTFPVWTVARNNPFSADLFHRDLRDSWIYGSQVWHYLVSRQWSIAKTFDPLQKPVPLEGWNYPGLTMLGAALAYVVCRLRRVPLAPGHERLLDRGFGVVAGLVVLSFAGGVSTILILIETNFRAYGRAGVMAIGIWAVMAAVVIHGLVLRARSRTLRWSLSLAIAGVVAYDGYIAAAEFQPNAGPMPAWVGWLARQPADVHAAPFPQNLPDSSDYAFYHLLHRHETLIGAEAGLFTEDLALVGASRSAMNERALELATSFGYETLIFDPAYLRANPWVTAVGWLERVETLADGWVVYRASSEAPRFARVETRELLARYGDHTDLTDVPAVSWITDNFNIPVPTVITDRGWVWLEWVDGAGRSVRRPAVALLQRYLSPSLPAYTILTPKRPGWYRLRFLDGDSRVLAERRYHVTDRLRTSEAAAATIARGARGNTVDVGRRAADGGLVVVENHSPYYLQVHTRRSAELAWRRLEPSVGGPSDGSVYLDARVAGAANAVVRVLLPHDLPAHSSLTLRLSETALPDGDANLVPRVAGVQSDGGSSDVTVSIASPSGELSRSLRAGH
jgi:hypothetical protein